MWQTSCRRHAELVSNLKILVTDEAKPALPVCGISQVTNSQVGRWACPAIGRNHRTFAMRNSYGYSPLFQNFILRPL